MIRSIAQYLIQNAYDDAPSGASDPLPRWLRKWVSRDPVLQSYEIQIQQLESSLRGQLDSFVAQSHPELCRPHSSPFVSGTLQPVPREQGMASPWQANRADRRSPERIPRFNLSWTLAAAALFFAVIVGTFVFTQSRYSPDDNSHSDIATSIPNFSPTRAELDRTNVQSILAKSIEASRHLAVRLTHTRKQSIASIEQVASQSMLEPKQIQEVCRGGLQFVTQRLPAATVRMLGMSAIE